jgi:transcription antitermination protein NusB
MKSRTKARGIALQVLYEFDLTGHQPAVIFERRLEEVSLEPTQVEFVRKIVTGVSPIFAELDFFIAKHAPEWPLNQVAVIDRNILRIALWEFAIEECTPTKVAINEAVELAKLFGSDSTPRFVNGVLGSLASSQQEIKTQFLASKN